MTAKCLTPLLSCLLLFLTCTKVLAEKSVILLDSAYRLHYQRKEDKALEIVNQAARLNPTQPLILLARAQFEIRNLQFKQAVKDCDAAIKINPKLGGAYSRRGFSYCRLGKYDRGIADLTRSIALHQVELTGWDAPFDYKNRAAAYRLLGDTKLAEKDEQMSQIYSAIERARGYRSQIQLAPAVAIMNDAVRGNPDDRYLRYFRGITTMNDGKLENAIADFTFVMKQDPTCTSVYYFRGDCYSRLHRMQDAINDYTKVLAKNPFVVAISDTAESGRCKGRELTYDESIVSPADIYVLRAQQYNLLKQYDKALGDFNKAISLAPGDAGARKERANLYLEMKNVSMALQDCNAIIAQEPKAIEFYELRAKILETDKQPDKALLDLTKIISLSKTDPPAYLRRGQLYERLGQYLKAIGDYSTAADLNPSEDDAFRYRGSSYFKLGHYDKAIDDYSQAISRDPGGNIETYLLRALAYDKLGKTDLATKDRNTARAAQATKAKSFH